MSAALVAAVELDLFTAIDEGRRTAAAIAAARGGTERSIRILLDALAVALPRMLRKSAGRYGLTPFSRRFLVRTSPAYVGPLAALFGHRLLWDAFRDLPAAVRAGTSVLEKDAHAAGQPFWEDFARATALDAVPKALAILRLLKRAPNPCEILDLACGSGAYGSTLAQWIPGARLTLFDQPHVLAAARRLVEVPARYVEGDLFATEFGGPYDLIVASHVFHHFDPEECGRLAAKVAAALKPEGRLVIQEFIPDEKRSRKAHALLFALTMLVWTRAGDAYTLGDYRRWLRAAGFRKIAYHALAQPGDVIIASR